MSKSPTKVMRRKSVKPRTDSQRTKEAFLTDLRTRVRVAVDILSHHISQRRLEHLLGLSQGYLSRLRACVSNPSAELVANLAMLCQDPPTRLLELERFWALPAENGHRQRSQRRAPHAPRIATTRANRKETRHDGHREQRRS
jgi:transcriptional regulator with XRE-family HTH domain